MNPPSKKQRSLQKTLRLLEAAIGQSHEAITITTADLDEPGPEIVFVNPAFTRITGYESSEVLGKYPRILQGPLTEREVLNRLRQNLSQGASFSGETINYRKDGTPFWMEWEITPFRNEKAVITHYVATQRDVTERHENQARLQRQFERLTALRAIDMSIVSNRDFLSTLGLILDQVRTLLGVDAAAISLMNQETNSLEYIVRRGFQRNYQASRPAGSTEEPGESAVREGRLITLLDLPQQGAAFLQRMRDSGESFADYYAVPLVATGAVQGILELFHRDILRPDAGWLEFLEMLSGQAAIAIQNAALVSDLERANRELVISYDATIEGWARALDLRDKETEGHSRRVTDRTKRLAQHMGIEGNALLQIHRGALLHDVGKLGIPDNVLLKPGPLTEAEWAIMRQHPIYAYEMLYPIAFLRPALEIPYCHHEKWDGTGYPNGLKGEAIPFAARIFAVADVTDALQSNRPYRAKWPTERVREHIRALAGTHFDPKVVDAFLQLEM